MLLSLPDDLAAPGAVLTPERAAQGVVDKVVAEGAGAASLAAAIHDPRLSGNIVCVISGGNIDADDYVQALQGKVVTESESKRDKFAKKGQLLPRERVARLLDRGLSIIHL